MFSALGPEIQQIDIGVKSVCWPRTVRAAPRFIGHSCPGATAATVCAQAENLLLKSG
jgi:hypothetical protein